LLACAALLPAEEKPAPAEEAKTLPVADVKHDDPVDFEREILPIFQRSCLACHSKTEQKADLVLETPETIREGGKSGPAVVAGKSAESLLFLSATQASKPFMPPKQNKINAGPLKPEELGLLKLWIDQGATGTVKSSPKKVEWRPLAAGVNPIYATALSLDGRLAACGRGNQLFLYNLASGQPAVKLVDPELGSAADPEGVQSLAFDPQASLLASGGYRVVRLWRRSEAPQGPSLADLGAPVTSMAPSADGARVAFGTADGRVILWTVADQKTLRPLAAHAAAVTGLHFSADGAKVFSASADGTAAAWGAADGFPEARISAQAPVQAVALAAKGAQLALGCADGVVRVWTLPQNGAAAAPPAALAGHQKPVTSLVVVPTADTQLVSGSEDGTVRFWDLATLKETRQANHGAPVTSVAVRPDGQAFASSGADKRAVLWNLGDFKVLAELRGDPDSKLLADVRKRESEYLGGAAQNLKNALAAVQKKVTDEEKKVADAKTALEKLVAEQTAAQAALAAKSPTDKAKAEADMAAAKKKAEEAVNAASEVVKSVQEEAKTAKTKADDAESAQKKAQTALEAAQKAASESESPIRAVAFSADGAQLALAGDDGVVRVFGAKNGAPVDTFRGHKGPVSAVGHVKDRGFVSASADKSAALWTSGASWKLERALGSADSATDFADRVTAIAFSPDGATFATGGGEPSRSGELKLWKTADGSAVLTVPSPHSDVIFCVEFSPDGKWIASGGADKFVKVFEAATGKLVKAFEGHTHHVLGVTWRSDSKVIASSGADNVVKVWSMESGEQIRTIEGFGKQVTSIHFVPFTSTIVTSSGDRNVRLHNTDNGQAIRSIGGATEYLYSSGVTYDGKLVVAGGFAGVLHVWDATNGESRGAFGPQ